MSDPVRAQVANRFVIVFKATARGHFKLSLDLSWGISEDLGEPDEDRVTSRIQHRASAKFSLSILGADQNFMRVSAV